MARTRSIGNLRADAYKRADLENSTSFIPSAEVTEYVNQGYAALYRLLARAGRPNYFPTKSTLTTVSADPDYALSAFSPTAASFWLEIAVHATIDGAKHVLTEMSFDDIAALSDASSGWSGHAFRYRFIGDTFYLYPAPTAGHVIELWWIPAPTRYATDGSADASTIDGVADYEQYIIDFAARQMAIKDGNLELAALLGGDMAGKAEEIRALGAARSQDPPRVRDVTARDARLWSPNGRRRYR